MATTVLRPAATYRTGLYEWLTTTDHKKIGILYTFNSLILFLVGGVFALAVRTELAQPGLQFMTEATYNQMFTMHASVMIFWVVIPFLAGFGNYLVPLMIGAPDMAFPRINALSFWLLPLSAVIALMGFPLGGAAAAGWTSYSPLAQAKFSTGPGTDLWIVALTLVGTSSILGAINLDRTSVV
jgi:cytochrome c oxidase subunit 1